MQVELREYTSKIIGIIVTASLLVATTMYLYLSSPVAAQANAVVVTIPPGVSSYEISELLQKDGLIRNAALFRAMARMHNLEKNLQAGEYSISPNMTLIEVVRKLSRGETIYTQFTIPEGFTVNQVAVLLADKKLGSAEKYREYAKNIVIEYGRNSSPNVEYKVEGFLFPSTYKIAGGMDEKQIFDMMVGEFEKQLTPAMRQRAAKENMSIWDLIILASLVEKEARLPEERPIIARVFLNRLKIEMPLQSCATIQYILGYPKPELTVADTKIPSPYNTYLHGGLPPGPIANPGIASIKAVLYPDNNDYLYFVANSNGSHHFSKTYDGHLQAIREMQN